VDAESVLAKELQIAAAIREIVDRFEPHARCD
jgi:hypothetical protein